MSIPLSFADAVEQVSAIAQAKLPSTLHARLQMATALVNQGAVWTEDGKGFVVRSSSNPALWHAVNGHCSCEDASFRAPEGYCKHRLGLPDKTLEGIE
jgi:hypothetical protein